MAHQVASLSPRERRLDDRCRRTRSRPSPTSHRAEERVQLSRVQNLPQANEGRGADTEVKGRFVQRRIFKGRDHHLEPASRLLLPRYAANLGSGSMAIKGRAPRSSSRRGPSRSLARSRIRFFHRLNLTVRPMSQIPSPDTAAGQNGSSRDRLRRLCGQNCDRFRTQPFEVPSVEVDLLHQTRPRGTRGALIPDVPSRVWWIGKACSSASRIDHVAARKALDRRGTTGGAGQSRGARSNSQE